jgi:nitrate/TMAO reductase-like tetraheme cytochrome c subunit
MTPARVLLAGLRFFTARPLLLVVIVAAVAGGVTFGSMHALEWMETEEFCGRCHTMVPQVEAHADSAHDAVECSQCHVGAGLKGLVKAKVGGMRQMVHLVLGEYARPIPPASDKMPPANETCGRCHDPAESRGDKLIMRSRFMDDEHNTEQQLALVVRLAKGNDTGTSGIHWHVQSKVEYLASDPEDEHAREIDWVWVEKPDGTQETYVARSSIEISEQAGKQADQLRESGAALRMGCYDCHNRVGHDFRTPARAIDDALANGSVDKEIPYIKKNGLEVVTRKYASLEEAKAALDQLRSSYHQMYPRLFLERPIQLQHSFETLLSIYEESAKPEMEVSSERYPSQLGHTDSAGCFRCHDGGHFKVVDGKLSEQAIPSQCSLCHTFPSVGSRVPSVQLGTPPSNHLESLWVFQHKAATTSADPSGTTCGACHSQSYCTNCHTTGAKAVKHDAMSFDHAAVIREAGSQQSCAYCHQRPFCTRCHQGNNDFITIGNTEKPH